MMVSEYDCNLVPPLAAGQGVDIASYSALHPEVKLWIVGVIPPALVRQAFRVDRRAGGICAKRGPVERSLPGEGGIAGGDGSCLYGALPPTQERSHPQNKSGFTSSRL